MKKIGFVIPWYYKDIRGGAEQEMRGLVEHLHNAGVEVEIITTCVKEFASDWTENYFTEGEEVVNGITIRRFKVRKGDMKTFHEINAKLYECNNITYLEEATFLKEMVIVLTCRFFKRCIVKNIIGMFLYHICLEQHIMEFRRVRLNHFNSLLS